MEPSPEPEQTAQFHATSVSGDPARAPRKVDIRCIPKHAGRPIALCETGSGSGWWLRYIGPDGHIEYGPYVPNARTLRGQPDRVIVDDDNPITGTSVKIKWVARLKHIEVATRYANGKPYVFLIGADSIIRIVKW